MKKLLLGILCLFLGYSSLAQNQGSNLPTNSDTVRQIYALMEKADTSFWDVADFAEGYLSSTNDSVPISFRKTYARWQYFWRSRVDLTGDRRVINSTLSSMATNNTICDQNGQWTQEQSAVYDKQVSGIVTAIYAPPGQTYSDTIPPQIILAGSNTGGVWKTTNGGTTWANTSDPLRMSALGVNDIEGDPHVSGRVYMATGNTGSFMPRYGNGVYWSDDMGDTWHHVDLGNLSTFDPVALRVVVHPDPNSISGQPTPVYVLSGTKIYESLDGFASFASFDFNLFSLAWETTLFDLEIIPSTVNSPAVFYVSSKASASLNSKDSKIWRRYGNAPIGSPSSWIDITPEKSLSVDFKTDAFVLTQSEADPGVLYTTFQDFYSEPVIIYDSTNSPIDTIVVSRSDKPLLKTDNQGNIWTVIDSNISVVGGGNCSTVWTG
ncbi:MAG: hypothetical protein AAFN10_22915, partial [Bacteroidota bacterium]